VSKHQSSLFGIIPYIDPKKFNDTRPYSLNEKSDVYSVGVLLWEISSGQPPFEGEFQFNLPARILNGLREKVIPGTPEDYVNIYTGKYNFKFNISFLFFF
jgi:serine/threonine protein kinase